MSVIPKVLRFGTYIIPAPLRHISLLKVEPAIQDSFEGKKMVRALLRTSAAALGLLMYYRFFPLCRTYSLSYALHTAVILAAGYLSLSATLIGTGMYACYLSVVCFIHAYTQKNVFALAKGLFLAGLGTMLVQNYDEPQGGLLEPYFEKKSRDWGPWVYEKLGTCW